MKVLSAIGDPGFLGGIGTVVSNYLEWMDRNRPGEAEFLVSQVKAEPFAFLKSARGWSPQAGPLPPLLPSLQVPSMVARRMLTRRLEGYEEVHVIGAVPVAGYPVAGRCPTVLWCSTTIEAEVTSLGGRVDRARAIRNRATLPILRRLDHRVLLGAQKVLAQSPYSVDLFLGVGVAAERIELVPVPIDTDVFKPVEKERSGLLWVGRARDPRKRFDLVMKILERSSAARDRGLVVVSERAPIVPEPLRANVRHRGRVRDVHKVFRGAELLVLTSSQEGLGIVVFEAMASGTPVAILRCGGPDRFVEESGGGIVADDLDALVRGIDGLLADDQARNDMGRAARAWTIKNMSRSAFLEDRRLFTLG